ncbi:hypothetical protein EJB05_30703, partial [Eragrostis curvula]
AFSSSLLFFPLPQSIGTGLKVGFYNKSCASVETLVQQAVVAAFKNNCGIAAGLIRLHFDDCALFYRLSTGCDGSVLIDSTEKEVYNSDIVSPGCCPYPIARQSGISASDAFGELMLVQPTGAPRSSQAHSSASAGACTTTCCHGFNPWKTHGTNGGAGWSGFVHTGGVGWGGLAFAARDSVALTGNLTYKVPAGAAQKPGVQGDRRVLTLASPFSNATELVGKGLTPEDMVVLSGAHTVGQSHCSSFLHRIWNGTTAIVDPTISAAYASLLRSICPSNSNQTFPNTTTAMDLTSHDASEARQSLLRRARQQPGPLHVGPGAAHQRHAQRLKASVDAFVKSEKKWKSKFAKSMVKMGNIQVLTGTQGEIRLNCRVINSGGSSSSAGVELGMMTRSDGLDEI